MNIKYEVLKSLTCKDITYKCNENTTEPVKTDDEYCRIRRQCRILDRLTEAFLLEETRSAAFSVLRGIK